MTSESESPSGWRRALWAAWEKLPEIVIAALMALAAFGIRSWVTDRDHTHQITTLDAIVADHEHRLAALTDCVRRTECEAVRALVHAIELRLTAVESKALAHESTARELNGDWRTRLLDLERQIQRLATDATARPDPFTGRDGRALEDRIRQLEKRP